MDPDLIQLQLRNPGCHNRTPINREIGILSFQSRYSGFGTAMRKRKVQCIHRARMEINRRIILYPSLDPDAPALASAYKLAAVSIDRCEGSEVPITEIREGNFDSLLGVAWGIQGCTAPTPSLEAQWGG